MRAMTLGRWLFRLVVTIGAGSAALGLSTAAAHADVATGGRVVAADQTVSSGTTYGSIRPVPGAPVHTPVTGSPVATPPATTPAHGVYVTEDWGWG
jgi:hypothetical protein